jgi:hypothetical protein
MIAAGPRRRNFSAREIVCSDMRTILVALCAAALAVNLFGQKTSESELWDDLDYSLKGATSLHPKNGFVPDEVTAIFTSNSQPLSGMFFQHHQSHFERHVEGQ